LATILLIDDDEMVQNVTRELLNLLGYEVLSADDGRQALARAEEAAAAIDLVLLDLSLPDMSGLELLPKLRQILRSQAKVVLCSGSMCDQNATADQNGKGLDAVLQKPFELTTLKETVERVLAS